MRILLGLLLLSSVVFAQATNYDIYRTQIIDADENMLGLTFNNGHYGLNTYCLNCSGSGGVASTVDQGNAGLSPWLTHFDNTSINVGNFPAFALDSTLSSFQTASHADLSAVNTTLGSPFQSGGSIGNSSFGISGTLPAFASTPTVNNEPTSAAAVSGTLNSGSGAGSFLQLDATNMTTWVVDFGSTSTLGSSVVQFEKSINGTTWNPSFCYTESGAAISSFASAAGVPNINNAFECDAVGYSHFRARVSTYGTGSAAVSISANKNKFNVEMANLFTLTNNNPGQFVGIGEDDVGLAKDASLTTIDTDINKSNLAQASTTSGQTGALMQGAVTSSVPLYTTAKTNPLSLTTAGSLRTDLSSIVGSTIATGNGTVSPSVMRVAIASDNTAFSVNANQGGTWNVNSVQSSPTGIAANAWWMQGNVASGGTDSGNPVKTGGIFNTTQPTVTNGQRVDSQMSARGGQIIAKGVDGFSIDNTSFTATQATGSNLHTVTDSGTITTVGAVTAITNALPAGTNVIGKTSIDQTTPGTTNLVALTAETTKVIGTVNQGTSPWTDTGNKTNNNAAPGATNIGTLNSLANAAPPTWTEGNQVALSQDLAGNLRVAPHPFAALGVYEVTNTSGAYAGLSAATPLFAMRWGDATRLGIILRVRVMVVTTTAASTAGIEQRDLFVVRGFTASDTGGTAVTLTGNNAKRRTSMGTSLVTDMRFGNPLTAGTRTPDSRPVNSAYGWAGLLSTGFAIGGTGSSAVGAARSTEGSQGWVTLLDATSGVDSPIVLAQNEGIEVQIGKDNAQPSGATNQTFVNILWAEANSY